METFVLLASPHVTLILSASTLAVDRPDADCHGWSDLAEQAESVPTKARLDAQAPGELAPNRSSQEPSSYHHPRNCFPLGSKEKIRWALDRILLNQPLFLLKEKPNEIELQNQGHLFRVSCRK